MLSALPTWVTDGGRWVQTPTGVWRRRHRRPRTIVPLLLRTLHHTQPLSLGYPGFCLRNQHRECIRRIYKHCKQSRQAVSNLSRQTGPQSLCGLGLDESDQVSKSTRAPSVPRPNLTIFWISPEVSSQINDLITMQTP